MLNKEFVLAVVERAVKTFAQSLVAVFTAGSITLLDVNWTQALAVAGTAALVSVLTSLASAKIGNYGPSLTSESVAVDAPTDGLQP